MKLRFLLINCMFFLSTVCVSATGHAETLKENILQHVKACIAHDETIKDKSSVYELIEEIEQNHCAIESGNDSMRIKYVAAQGCFEHILASLLATGDIDELIGVIHTPTIATPLCVKPEGPFEAVLDESIRHDQEKLQTVRSRAHTVREFVRQGGQLFIVYPKDGQKIRTADQLSIYHEELDRFSNTLVDWMLTCEQLDPDMIGASYLFRDKSGVVYAFSIKARQAIDNQPNAEWGLWMGVMQEPVIADRVNNIFDYLNENGGPDARGKL